MVNPYDIILMPWITEKTLEARRVSDLENNYRENNNRIEFIVRRESTKTQIRQAVEMLLDVKVAKVNTKITITGKEYRNSPSDWTAIASPPAALMSSTV